MYLRISTYLGPYLITAPIGAGGMGEVYRAHDTRLNRDVAIKVLAPELAPDAAALIRFEREAQALASISHPALVAVYDIGHHDNSTFVAMELLDLSSDNVFIAATRRRGEGGGELMLLDTRRNIATMISDRDASAPISDPTWSPDGRQLAYRRGTRLVIRNAVSFGALRAPSPLCGPTTGTISSLGAA